MNKMNECIICLEEKNKNTFVKLNCSHDYCKECIIKTIKSDKRTKPCCPLCREEILLLTINNNNILNELTQIFT
jgi:hypothetical protein